MYMSVLSVYVYLYLVHVVLEVRRRQHIPWNWSNRQLCGITWVLGTKPKSLQEQQVMLSAVPSLHPCSLSSCRLCLLGVTFPGYG